MNLLLYLLNKGISEETIKSLTSSGYWQSPTLNSYKIWSIPKKNGSYRLIEEPCADLKNIQRAILPALQEVKLPDVVYGLKGKDKDAIGNAKQHSNKKVLIKMDIQQFFPSTTLDMYYAAYKYLKLSYFYYEIAAFCFIYDSNNIRLPTGAPTSPLLSSISFVPADTLLMELSKNNNLTYTRYMDDLTFSGDKYPSGFQKKVTKIVEQFGWNINHNKSKILYKDNHTQIVTGICTNNNINLSKKIRKNLRSEIAHLAKEPITPEKQAIIYGKISYAKQVNLKYGNLLEKYYLQKNNIE
jgi:hypothetical protein